MISWALTFRMLNTSILKHISLTFQSLWNQEAVITVGSHLPVNSSGLEGTWSVLFYPQWIVILIDISSSSTDQSLGLFPCVPGKYSELDVPGCLFLIVAYIYRVHDAYVHTSTSVITLFSLWIFSSSHQISQVAVPWKKTKSPGNPRMCYPPASAPSKLFSRS